MVATLVGNQYISRTIHEQPGWVGEGSVDREAAVPAKPIRPISSLGRNLLRTRVHKPDFLVVLICDIKIARLVYEDLGGVVQIRLGGQTAIAAVLQDAGV